IRPGRPGGHDPGRRVVDQRRDVVRRDGTDGERETLAVVGRAGVWLAGLAVLALIWLFGVWPPPVWWRTHTPRETAMMREAPPVSAGRPALHPVALASIAPVLQRMVIIGEDSRFKTHHGIDFIEIGDALQLDRHPRVWPTIRAVWQRR